MVKRYLSYSKKRFLQVLFLLVIGTVGVVGCNRSNVESPNNTDHIWGYGNTSGSNGNTFHSNTASIAEVAAYAYIDHNAFLAQVKEGLGANYQDIYNIYFQDFVYHQIEKQKQSEKYSIDYPLMINNPFGTNHSSIYLYLGNQQQKVIVYYTVSAADETIPDFSETMYINRTTSDELEGQIVGIIPGQQNKIVLDIRDDTGKRIAKKAYVIDVPSTNSQVAQKLTVEVLSELQYTRGLYHYLSYQTKGAAYVFYDNYGILRGNIPCNVEQKGAKMLPVDNQVLIECSDNVFALMNNLGKVIRIYSYNDGGNVIDYDYDNENNTVLLIVERSDDQCADLVVTLNLTNGEWQENTDFAKLIPDYQKIWMDNKISTENTVEEIDNTAKDKSNDWIELQNVQVMDGKDMIVLSTKLNSVIRINNIYVEPVIRWIIGPESIWKDTNYESLLLYESGKKTILQEIDSMTAHTSKKLKEGQIYLSIINRESAKEQLSSYFYQYVVDENLNRYRVVKTLNFTEATKESSAMIYGTHVIIGMVKDNVLLEYNDKGEIMLRIHLPNNNFSSQIFKYTMDRYWF